MVHIITIDKDSEKPVFRIEGEYDSDLMASFGKIFTSILNHGDGGYINITMVKKLHPLGLFVNRSSENVCRALIDEISKIKPYVMERDYRITLPNQDSLKVDEEVHVEVDPVPWGLDPYAAADGHVYTPDLVAHFQEDEAHFHEDEGTEIKYTADQIHPAKRTEHNFDATEVCDMEISNSLESVGIDQESKSKVHDKLENEIKEIIENCVHDLREIKGLGIPKTMDRDAAEKTSKCTMDTAMPNCKTRLHHSKSVSESLNNSRSQPLQQWKSVSISGDIKTFYEEVEFIPYKEVKDWPGTNGKLVQVDGEGSVSENIDQKNDTDESEYFLPQLDGLYDQERIESEERLHNANKVNTNDEERVETGERVRNRINSNNRMGTYDAPELSALLTTNIVIFPLGLICVLLGLIQFAGGQTVLLIAKSGNYYMRYPYQYSSSYISEAKNAGVLAFVSNHGTDDVVKATSNYYAEQLLHNVYKFKDISGTFLVGIWDWDWSLSNIQFQKVSKPYAKAWKNKYLHIVLNDLSMDLTGEFDAHSKHRLFEGRGKLYAHVCFHLQVTFSIGLHNTVQVEQCYAGFECPTNFILNMNTDYPNFVNDWIQDKMQTHLKAQMLCDGMSKFATDYQVYLCQWSIFDSNNPATAKCGNTYRESSRINSNDTNKNAQPERAIALCNKEQLVHCRTTNRGMPTSVTTYVY